MHPRVAFDAVTLDEILTLVAGSAPDDWHHISCFGSGTGPSFLYRLASFTNGTTSELEVDEHTNLATYRADAALTLAWGLGFDSHREDLMKPEWATAFDDDGYRGRWLDVRWCGAVVHREPFAAVKFVSGYAYLPVPEIDFADTGHAAADGPAVHEVTQREIDTARLIHLMSNNPPGNFDAAMDRAGFFTRPDDT